jgi:hypothetical protein
VPSILLTEAKRRGSHASRVEDPTRVSGVEDAFRNWEYARQKRRSAGASPSPGSVLKPSLFRGLASLSPEEAEGDGQDKEVEQRRRGDSAEDDKRHGVLDLLTGDVADQDQRDEG